MSHARYTSYDAVNPATTHNLLRDIAARATAVARDPIDLTLEPMRALLAALDNPQDRTPPVVHVAGTNGKGSTIAFLAAILEAAGERVHTYTSPWLLTPHDGLLLSGNNGIRAPIAESDHATLLSRIRACDLAVPPTVFEAQTAAAFLAFADQPADVVLLETGLGGRLDATNVVTQPALTIITPISVDHAEFLGRNVADIAREKAGILRKDVPVIVARQPDEAFGTIERIAGGLGAALHTAGRDWDAFEQHGRLVFQNEHSLRDLSLPALAGRYQIENAGVAIAAAEYISSDLGREPLTDGVLEQGLATVISPARLQPLDIAAFAEAGLPEGSEIWLDGGHNADAATVLASALADMDEATPMPIYLVTAMLSSKDPDVFLRPFRGLVRTVNAVPLPERANATAKPARRSAIVGAAEANGIEAHAMSGVPGALEWIARQSVHPARILICGSFQLAAHVLEITTDKKEEPGTTAGL
ncbi:MAG: folylpolyglutamate synthase/dihydrofolate synthase family protein [Pseudomonadota bacterium]